MVGTVCCLWYVRSCFNKDWLARCAVCGMYVVGSITIGWHGVLSVLCLFNKDWLARCAVCGLYVVGSITIGWHGVLSVVCT